MATREEKIAFLQSQLGAEPNGPTPQGSSQGPTREEKIAFLQSKLGGGGESPQPQAEERPWYAFNPMNMGAGAMEAMHRLDENVMAPVRKFVTEKVTGEKMDHAPSGAEQAKMLGAPTMTYGERFNLPEWVPGRNISPADIYGVGLEVAQDPTNAIPLIGPAKKAIQATETGAKVLNAVEKGATKLGTVISDGAKATAKKGISVALGPSVENINHYLMNPEGVRNAKSVEEVKNLIDQSMAGIFDAVDQAKISRADAKEALRNVEGQIKDASRDASFKFAVDKAELKDQFKAAHEKLNQAFAEKKAALTEVKSPVHLADDVGSAIQDLKSKVQQGSEESYQILDQDRQAYSVRNGAKVLRQMADEMDIKPFERELPGARGSLVSPNQYGSAKPLASRPVTSESRGVQAELRKFADMLEQTPEMVPATELKKILQQIDASEKAAYGQPGFDSRVSQAYKNIRATIDQAIKDKNPAYRAKMQEVAQNMGLMQEAISRFGDPRAAASKLNSIGSRTAGADRALLNQIGEVTGRNFDRPVNEYLTAQSTLKNPQAMTEIEKSLPEYRDARLQEIRLNNRSRPEVQKQFIEKSIQERGLPEAKAKAESDLLTAEQNLTQAHENLEPVKSLTPTNSQNSVKSLMRGAGKENIEIRKQLEHLSQVSEKDFVQMIRDTKAAEGFKGEYRGGSRNVVFWSAVTGSALGPTVGIPVGAAIGAAVDKYGPRMAQQMLDGALKVKGSPTIAKIQALKLDPKVEFYLIKELGRAGSDYQNALKVSEEKKKGPDRWANDGLQKLLDHTDDEETKRQLQDKRDALLSDPKLKDLLIQASDLKPGSKSMDNIMMKIKSRTSKAGE